ncbi:MAG: endonuclease domain-containing protein [Gammaproteobacteria bacterium]
MKGFTKYLHTHQTDTENLLWKHLRNRQLDGRKFRRQVLIGKYIVDFVCFESNIVIEVDGGQHMMHQEKDELRSRWLHSREFMVLRFWNSDVLSHTQAVLEEIRTHLLLPPHPSLSREGRGDKVLPSSSKN